MGEKLQLELTSERHLAFHFHNECGQRSNLWPLDCKKVYYLQPVSLSEVIIA